MLRNPRTTIPERNRDISPIKASRRVRDNRNRERRRWETLGSLQNRRNQTRNSRLSSTDGRTC